MNVAVIYGSKTGHTKLIAEVIADEFGVEAMDILDKPELNDIDLLFIGTGIYAGKVSPELITYLDTVNPAMVKKAVLFSTSGAPNIRTAMLRDFVVRKGIEVSKDEFHCFGRFLAFYINHPDKQDVFNAKKFAKYVTK